ncbi:MAG: CinA family protein [Candidatus Thorarchaeota archaeon]
MVKISQIGILGEFINRFDLTPSSEAPSEPLGNGYAILHQGCEKYVVPLIQRKKKTLAITELTTCGLISDLLTGVSGASQYFLLGVIPYSTDAKMELGVSYSLLTHEGPGTVSHETAQALANRVRLFSRADISLAETGLLSSASLAFKRTAKAAGTVFLSIVSQGKVHNEVLRVDPDLDRRMMRLEIAGYVLISLYTFLEGINDP